MVLSCVDRNKERRKKPPPYGNFATDVMHDVSVVPYFYIQSGRIISAPTILWGSMSTKSAARLKHHKHIKKDRYAMYRSFVFYLAVYSRPATRSPIWAVVTGRKPSS